MCVYVCMCGKKFLFSQNLFPLCHTTSSKIILSLWINKEIWNKHLFSRHSLYIKVCLCETCAWCDLAIFWMLGLICDNHTLISSSIHLSFDLFLHLMFVSAENHNSQRYGVENYNKISYALEGYSWMKIQNWSRDTYLCLICKSWSADIVTSSSSVKKFSIQLKYEMTKICYFLW